MRKHKIKLIGFFVVLTFLIALPSQDANSTTIAEREALIAFYHSTDGLGWIDNSGWLGEEGTECSWWGVTCDEQGSVIVINLSGNQLTGSIPPEIGNLVKLENLLLYNNQLSGSIPSEIGNLVNLYNLSLSSNQLSGSIPSGIVNLVNLGYLGLSFNQLTGSIPTEIGKLVNLGYLDLSFNQLTGSIPSEIGNLVNLKYLYLSDNQLIGSIPSTFSNLTVLDTFNVIGNCLVDFEPVKAPINDVPNLIGADESCECIAGDTRETTCGVGECRSTGIETCSAGTDTGIWGGIWGGDTCQEGTPSGEVCDNLDNDCDGSVDEGPPDSDNDGIADACDNCPDVSNTSQLDTDKDTIGDRCDDFPNDPNYATDTDNDGLPDVWEAYYFADLDEIDSGDRDGDGFSNIKEYKCVSVPVDSSSQCNRGLPWLMLLLD